MTSSDDDLEGGAVRIRNDWLDAAQRSWERSRESFPHLDPEDAEAVRLVRAIQAYEEAKIATVRAHTNRNLKVGR